MRETIKGLIEYIECNCKEGRDDFEIAVLHHCIASIYSALDAIKRVEDRYCDDCPNKDDCTECMYED